MKAGFGSGSPAIPALLALCLCGGLTAAASSATSSAATPQRAATSTVASIATSPGCQLGNGVSHVIEIVFDNVHFFRDNPNVPSDLELMPHLLNFLKSNGTVFSNSHTPLIAHTADDSLTIYTGLYGDRHGQPVSNSYDTYNPDGSTDPATSFAYWTDPVADTASTPSSGHDSTPSMAYSATVPATAPAQAQTPAPWVPFTRAGCSVGAFSAADLELENAGADLPTVFGTSSPEYQQYLADSDPYKDPENSDYIGVAVHCAKGAAVCADASGVKYGQSTPSPTAVADRLPTEPGGYTGYQALFGARYIAPQLGAGTPSLTRHGYEVTNSAGNLVDLSGKQINGAYVSGPGFPGFDPTASQTLAYLADMQESGIPVTYGYISDLHELKPGYKGCTTASATYSGQALGPGDSCYVAQAQAYDAAFETFFNRLAADGITPANTEFVISAEENDQFAGANVGRATSPTPAGCDGVTLACHYSTSQIGELQANISGLLSGTASAQTTYTIDPQGASIYVNGQPSANNPAVRQLERDSAAMTATNAYSGAVGEKIVKYQASALEERVLHMRTADPLRLPTYTMFPVPDYYFSTSGPNVSINNTYAWNHGYYSPNIDITWVGMAGPGVAARGVDGPGPAGSNEAQDPNSTNTVPQASTIGTWVEETDIRPTLLYLVGLHDDYPSDGAVIAQALADPSPALVDTEALLASYQQLQSSEGAFATNTLLADSAALASGTASDDVEFAHEQGVLSALANARDTVANYLKQVFAAAANGVVPSAAQLAAGSALVKVLLAQAQHLAAEF